MIRHLSLVAYVLLIIIGAIGIIIPGLIHVCVACGSLVDTVLQVAAIAVGIVGLATRGQAVAA